MKLSFSHTSPYVRKVSVVLIETGLDKSVERIVTNVRDDKSDLVDYNPLGKIPTLITDNNTVLFDSRVICEYLDSLHDEKNSFQQRTMIDGGLFDFKL